MSQLTILRLECSHPVPNHYVQAPKITNMSHPAASSFSWHCTPRSQYMQKSVAWEVLTMQHSQNNNIYQHHRFSKLHREWYFFCNPHTPYQILTIRTQARRRSGKIPSIQKCLLTAWTYKEYRGCFIILYKITESQKHKAPCTQEHCPDRTVPQSLYPRAPRRFKVSVLHNLLPCLYFCEQSRQVQQPYLHLNLSTQRNLCRSKG